MTDKSTTEAPPPKPKTLEQMSITELKALAYEQVLEAQRIQNNLSIIQAEIAKRGKVPGA